MSEPERLVMPCLEGNGHRWVKDDKPVWWGIQCAVCHEYKSDLQHHHGMVCRWEWEAEGGVCDFVRERANRLATRTARSEARWAELRESYRRADARREERQNRWRQVVAEYESRQAARQELRHQRRRLREGHQTLTAIRRFLRGPGHRSSLVLVSEPATSSQT